jgi:hypothetical protein
VRAVGSRSPTDRGQLVLLAGGILAVGLFALLLAYLQLGYAPEPTQAPGGGIERVQSQLGLATHEAGAGIEADYAWGERAAGVDAVRGHLAPRLRALNESALTGGVVYQVAPAPALATNWTRAHCPGGPNRQFGPCEADAGVVVQERAGRTHVLAVAYDVTRTSDGRRTHLRTVVRVVPRR